MAVGAQDTSNRQVVFFVASRDLLNELLITACLILSVMAVLAPILLLTSVKVGFIDRLRQDFIQDPSFREIRPVNADLRPMELMDKFREWPDVRYVMPSVMLVPREVDIIARPADGPVHRSQARLLPSDPTDPMLEELAGVGPEGDRVVITGDVARDAGLKVGDSFTISASRIENDKRRRVEIEVTVAGIANEEKLTLPTILADASIDRDIESYRAGIAVPSRGWKGVDSVPIQTYQYIVADYAGKLGESLRSKLSIRVGSAGMDELDRDGLSRLTGVTPAAGVTLVSTGAAADRDKFIVLAKGGGGYSINDVTEANAVLANSEAQAYGLNRPVTLRLFGKDIAVAGYDPALMGADAIAQGASIASSGGAFSLNSAILLPRNLEADWIAAGSPRLVEAAVVPEDGWQTRDLTVSLSVAGFDDVAAAVASAPLIAMLRRGEKMQVAFDQENRTLVELSTGFRGFRLIGETIESIPLLVERFEAEGIAVRAKSDEILKLQRLERSLNILVAVVSLVALGGGYAILTSSFFANVQRKQVDYATMRLLGMARREIFRIPITQAVIVAILGYLLSVACFLLISEVLNRFIAAELGFDGQLSKLYASHFMLFGVFVLVGSCLASLAASREATNIDPAQALRRG